MQMAAIERIYTIPLRRGTIKSPRTNRAKKAIAVLKTYIERHMKSKDISLSNKLNEHVWSQGMRNPIMKVTVSATKDDKNKVMVKLATETLEAKSASDAKDAKRVADKATAKADAAAKSAEAPKAERKKAAKAPKAAEQAKE